MVTITAETVAAAAGRLQGDGTNPTQSAVRTALGGGSFSTIGPLLHKWRDNQAEAAELAKVDLPDTLADAGSDLMSRVWKVAIAEAFAGHDALSQRADPSAGRDRIGFDGKRLIWPRVMDGGFWPVEAYQAIQFWSTVSIFLRASAHGARQQLVFCGDPCVPYLHATRSLLSKRNNRT